MYHIIHIITIIKLHKTKLSFKYYTINTKPNKTNLEIVEESSFHPSPFHQNLLFITSKSVRDAICCLLLITGERIVLQPLMASRIHQTLLNVGHTMVENGQNGSSVITRRDHNIDYSTLFVQLSGTFPTLYRCVSCHKTVSNRWHHANIHRPQSHECPVCGQKFTRRDNMKVSHFQSFFIFSLLFHTSDRFLSFFHWRPTAKLNMQISKIVILIILSICDRICCSSIAVERITKYALRKGIRKICFFLILYSECVTYTNSFFNIHILCIICICVCVRTTGALIDERINSLLYCHWHIAFQSILSDITANQYVYCSWSDMLILKRYIEKLFVIRCKYVKYVRS